MIRVACSSAEPNNLGLEKVAYSDWRGVGGVKMPFKATEYKWREDV
jgi:hypothetical protein